MANETKRGDPQLEWIYEGTKALVNREDYLLGKRVDKNFELYSDAVIKEKETPIEAIVERSRRRSTDQNAKISNLGVNIVRNEDPLVAIKVKEEKLRQEKLENPLMMLKIQKLLKEAMEKKARKMQKKLKKKEKKARRERKQSKVASSDSDSDDNNEKHSRGRATSSSHKHRHHKKKHRSKESESDGMKRRRRHSSNGNVSPAKLIHHRRRRHSTKSSSSDENNTRRIKDSADRPSTSTDFTEKNKKSKNSSSTKRTRQLDSHIPEHLRPKREYTSSGSSSESDSMSGKSDKADNGDSHQRFGLIDKKRRSSELKDGKKDAQGSEKHASNPYELVRFKPTIEPYKKEERRKLTHEEIEMKRREMIKNAEWRDSTRLKNITKARKDDEAEIKDEHSKPADFIKPMLNKAASSMTVERQLNSHRQGLQRSHDYMEQKFATR